MLDQPSPQPPADEGPCVAPDPDRPTLRVQVDLNRCVGYAQCCFPAAAVFRMSGEEALEFDASPAPEHADAVRRAAAACPVQAITLGEALPPAPALARSGPRVVVIGASLAGLRAAEAARRSAPDAAIVVIGDERHAPYDRPPLSKAMLSGAAEPGDSGLPALLPIDAEWRLGVRAARLDAEGRRVHLADGTALPFDRLVVATGARARPWPRAEEAALRGVLTVRTVEDAGALRRALAAGPSRVAVIGGGFIGSEVASVCRSLGLPVALVERGLAPLAGALGRTVGLAMAARQRAHGVDLRTETSVEAIEGDGEGRVAGLRLEGGQRVAAEVVVVALGAQRNVEWLEGSGLMANKDGLRVDSHARALCANGTPHPAVFAAGDVARWPDAFFGEDALSVEHWSNAVAQAATAGANLLRPEADLASHDYMPTFWSSQFGLNLKSVGLPRLADAVQVVQGSLAGDRFAAVFGRAGRVVGALTANEGRFIDFYAHLVRTRAPFPTALRTALGPQPMS